MKHLIVVAGTMILGCIIFYMLVGSENSLKESCSDYLRENIEIYKERI